jgi:Aspartyl/Asparaginyl beta-hydroxylase
MTMPDRVRLPLRFDAEALRSDLANLPGDAWTPHFNQGIYSGDWSGVALRSVGGTIAIYPDPTRTDEFADTEHLARCPNIAAALRRLECPLQSARLLRLGPASTIKPHDDYRLSFDDGEVRVHVPITTDDAVEFLLNGTPVDMAAGDCWYMDFTKTHSVTNRGPEARINLVVDCNVNEWLTEQLRQGARRVAGVGASRSEEDR